MLWGRSRRAPPLNPHLPIRTRQPLLLRPRLSGGRPVHRAVHHGAHFSEPPGCAGQAIFPARNPRCQLSAAESKFQLLVCCHKCLSIYDPSLAGGVGQKPSEAKDSRRNFLTEIPQGRNCFGMGRVPCTRSLLMSVVTAGSSMSQRPWNKPLLLTNRHNRKLGNASRPAPRWGWCAPRVNT